MLSLGRNHDVFARCRTQNTLLDRIQGVRAPDKSVLVNKVSIDWTFFCSLVITGVGRHWCQLCNISHAKWWAQRFYRNCTLSCCIVLHKRNILGMRLFAQLLININIIKLFSLYELGFYSRIPRDMPMIHVNIVSLSVCLCVSLCLSVSLYLKKKFSLSLSKAKAPPPKKNQNIWSVQEKNLSICEILHR